MKPTTLLWCAAFVAACANVTPPSPDQEPRLDQARALLNDDPVRALEVVDAILAEHPHWREARLVAAEGSLRMAKSGRGSAGLHLQDAARNFERAIDGADDADYPMALQLLAECRYELGEFEASREAAMRAVAAFAATPATENRTAAANALLLAGKCDLQRFVTAVQSEKQGGERDARGKPVLSRGTVELASRAAAAFERARGELPGEATTQLALVYQWLEQPAAVMREYEQGMRAAPQATAIHDAYIGWMRDQGHIEELVGAYAQFVRENPGTPILRWHQGRAIYTRADQLRADGNFHGAIAGYTKADGVFADYLAMMPAHADGVGSWRALCQLAMARCAADMGDLRSAEQHLFAAGDASPHATEYPEGAPALVDSFGNHFTGCVGAIATALTESGDDALANALAFNERVLQRWPDRWGFLYNNAALGARDLGVRKAQLGEDAAAKDLWERSYGYYQKAVALVPDDARIVNDCGLMLIYHLDRDLEHARSLFDRAIELGKQQLAALPADATSRNRELLEEAVACRRSRVGRAKR
jgi:tetratricopeptide (TPR) repeat protein